MFALDLNCGNGHTFEGWFSSSDSFYRQQQAGEITCPVCDDKRVSRVLSPVAIRRHTEPAAAPEKEPASREMLQQVYRYIQSNFEDVGTDFAKEALKIHYGAAEKRNIKGTSTADEEKTLQEEGVEFYKIPVPKEGN